MYNDGFTDKEKEKFMLTSKQRAYLRSLAVNIDTIFQIGKGGITEEMCRQLNNALEARELIKIKILDNCAWTPREAADAVSEVTESEVVSVIGKKFVLYKESTENKKIELIK